MLCDMCELLILRPGNGVGEVGKRWVPQVVSLYVEGCGHDKGVGCGHSGEARKCVSWEWSTPSHA
jgi:hypothetical protein